MTVNIKLTGDELKQLAASPDFQAIIAGDPELDALEAAKYDHEDDYLALMETLGYLLKIGPVTVQPITAAVWSLWWAIGSPYARNGAIVTTLDVDIALYTLAHGLHNLGCAPRDLVKIASGYCAGCGLDAADVHEEIQRMIRIAFLPLAVLPPDGGDKDYQPRYDTDWLTRIVGIAACESNERASYVAREMSLSSVCAYFVQRCRRESDRPSDFRRRESGEVASAIMERAYALGREYLDKLKSTNKES